MNDNPSSIVPGHYEDLEISRDTPPTSESNARPPAILLPTSYPSTGLPAPAPRRVYQPSVVSDPVVSPPPFRFNPVMPSSVKKLNLPVNPPCAQDKNAATSESPGQSVSYDIIDLSFYSPN